MIGWVSEWVYMIIWMRILKNILFKKKVENICFWGSNFVYCLFYKYVLPLLRVADIVKNDKIFLFAMYRNFWIFVFEAQIYFFIFYCVFFLINISYLSCCVWFQFNYIRIMYGYKVSYYAFQRSRKVTLSVYWVDLKIFVFF